MSRKGENIYKRKDGRWEGRYIKGRNFAGKAIYGYIYSKTYKDAKSKLVKAKNVSQDEQWIHSKKISEVALVWLDSTLHYCKQSTYVKYRNTVHKHIIPILGNYAISEVDTNKINNFCQHKLFTCKLSPKTVKDILSVVKLICKFAANMGQVCKCDFSGISIKSIKNTTAAMNHSQIQRLTHFLIHNINHVNVGILISIYTGIRIGELCALKYDDINLETKTIQINKTLQRLQNFEGGINKTDIIISPPKSECSVREIPIPEFIVNTIIENNFYVKNAYILTGDNNKYIEPRTMENKFNKISSICGIDNVTFHTIRHTFASTCIEAGVDVKSLSEILGHSSVNITLNRYVHSSMQLKRTNMEKFYAYSCLSPSAI